MLGRPDPGSRGVPAPSTTGSYDDVVRFEVLGRLRALLPVEAGVGGPVPEPPLGGPKQQLVLALLLAQPNTVVSVDRLIDGVWGATPPDSARHTLQSYVSELRKSLGEAIERDGTGYSVRVDQRGLDSLEFEARVSEARARLDRDPAGAAADLGAALALWRGRPYEDFPDHADLQAEAARLEELRLVAVEAALHARLTLGDHLTAAVELERHTREHPYREGLRALQMLALYRSGRQADALRAFQAMRTVLADELGIDPSPRLRRLEEQILLQDPDLDPAHPASPERSAANDLVENPYLGLRPFREPDAARFFGRDQLVDQLTARVVSAAPFTAVVGPSGSGKSSAVQAGLLPRVREEVREAVIAVVQPGLHPFAELDGVLAALGRVQAPASATDGLVEAARRVLQDGERLLLVVDQFEELYTLTAPDEAQAFIDALVGAVQHGDGRVQVLVTMRADFYDRPLADPNLGPLFVDNLVHVVPMGPDELEAAATLPAQQMDVRIEPRLVARLIADVAGQPNALPLFQYALTELFDERTGAVLDLATYERVGGVRTAVARRAESLFNRLDGPEQEAVRQLFLRIATISGSVVGRRRVPASELTTLEVDIVALQTAIDLFARYRLLALDRDPSTGIPTVEVAHEALLAEWRRLSDWIDESRDDLATHARFAVAVHEWEAVGRDAGYLLTGTRLADYERWAATSRLRLTDVERAFLQEAVDARDARSAEDAARTAAADRLRRRSRVQLATLVAVAALLAGLVAYPIVAADDPRGQIAIALDAPRSGGAFNELIARGVESAAAEHGLDAVVLEPPYTDPRAMQGELAEASELLFGSFLMWDDMVAIAPDHPDSTFVFLDFVDPPTVDNGVSVAFAHEEGSYLVGAAAALESKTGKIGYIGANASPDLIETFRAGFEQGARAVDPEVEIVASLISPGGRSDGYQDIERAKELARWMYTDERVDVIYTAAGGSGRGVVEVAAELSEPARQLWAIGVDTDFLFELPAGQREHLLTSMVKRLDVGIERVVAGHLDGSLEVPSNLRVGLAEGAVGYSTSGGHLAPTTIDTVDRLAAEIADGERSVDDVPTGEVRLPPSAPVAPDTPESRAALDVASRYFRAFGSGDVGAMMALLAPDVDLVLFGVWLRERWANLLAWEKGAEVEFVDLACTPRSSERGLVVECAYGARIGIADEVGAPDIPEVVTFQVQDGLITALYRTVLDSEVDEELIPRFLAWVDAHHPADAGLVECCGEGGSVEGSERRGALAARYAKEWAAYLDSKGCTYDEEC
jgi:basic membrane lipoprotein Med (substrate-binding protein (PBP1-ABC) superfamily)/DNA-binding SARP family transcriptional activator